VDQAQKSKLSRVFGDDEIYELFRQMITEVIDDRVTGNKCKSSFDRLYAHVVAEGRVEARNEVLNAIKDLRFYKPGSPSDGGQS
jgi:hypothetical protein